MEPRNPVYDPTFLSKVQHDWFRHPFDRGSAGYAIDLSASRAAYAFLTANTPSPFNSVANPACRKRFATSPATSRPLVSLFGVPV